MNKKLMFVVKLVVMAGILGYVAWKLQGAWSEVSNARLQVDWRFGVVGIVTFALTMMTSGLTWRWLAWRMGDRHRTLPLLGAYMFSQMGKYIPGKVGLLLMRIERAGRVGMGARVCIVATLVENAMYMISGGLVAVATMVVFLRDQPALAGMVAAGMAGLLAVFHPRVFYWIMNKALVKMKQPALEKEQQLKLTDLLAAVAMCLPCWIFGGISLWAAARSITFLPAGHLLPMPGAYALGVTGGMASLLPGGLGTNEGIKSLFLVKMLDGKFALLAVAVQRMFQITVEMSLGLAGAMLTSVGQTGGGKDEAVGATGQEAAGRTEV